MDVEYLTRVLGATVLTPTEVKLPRTRKRKRIVTLLRRESRAPVVAAKCADCYAPNKPVLKFGRRRTWAEFLVLGLLERDGWSGRWIKNWSGPGRPRLQVCAGIGKELAISDPRAAALFARVDERAGHPAGGIWDLFAWRGADYLIIESKQYRRRDNLHDDPSQLRWLEACHDEGLSLDSFALVRYDAGDASIVRPVARGLSSATIRVVRDVLAIETLASPPELSGQADSAYFDAVPRSESTETGVMNRCSSTVVN